MSSSCIASCVNDARAPVRATYVNLYKWPESDAEFVRSVSSRARSNAAAKAPPPRVVDSISCRQMYLRSYTFSRKKETVPERTKKCLRRVKERVSLSSSARRRRRRTGATAATSGKKRGDGMRRVKEMSCAALFAIFRRLLLCAATVDVVDGND